MQFLQLAILKTQQNVQEGGDVVWMYSTCALHRQPVQFSWLWWQQSSGGMLCCDALISDLS